MANIFKIDPTSLFSSIITDAQDATLVAGKATSYVLVAEQIGAAYGLTGTQKLAAVKSMLLADLQQSWPAGYTWLQNSWPQISGVISAMVAIFNAVNWMFQAAEPILAIADPSAIPALTAVNAAITAAQALQKAIGVTTVAPAVVTEGAPAIQAQGQNAANNAQSAAPASPPAQ